MTKTEYTDKLRDMVYDELHSDGDNCRANRIIDAADEYAETEQEPCDDAISRQALSEEDYIELRHRFGTVVENVVRDMVNGKGERWEQAQADGDNVFKMRDATPEERESIDKYIKSISKPTGIEFDKEQEPKTGHWIVDSATSSQIGIHGKKTFSYDVHCDKCRWKWAYTTDKKDSTPSNYCPNCGAKMSENPTGSESEVDNG